MDKIIDFRYRPRTPEAVKGMLAPGGVFSPMFEYYNFKDRAFSNPIEECVEMLREHRVVKAVVVGRDAETTYGLRSSNAGIVDLTKRWPDLFIGYAGLDPMKGMKAIDELKARVEVDGFQGAAIDPYLARIPADHRRYYPIYAKCCELNIPIIVCTGPATLVADAVMGDAHPAHIDRVAADFPDLRIIMSHGGYPYVAEAIMVVERNANVYMDITEYETQPFSEKYVEAANTIIGHKIFYASSAPFMDFREQIDRYERQLPFTPEVRENVMYRNAARFLGLE